MADDHQKGKYSDATREIKMISKIVLLDAYQKGTALITAMVIMSILAAIATVIITQQARTIYRSQLLFNIDRAYLYTNGAVVWAESLLKQRAGVEDVVMVIADVLPPTPTPYDEGEVSATLEDLQGRFNLNNLHYDEKLNGKLDQLRRLISIILFDIDENQINQVIQLINKRGRRLENLKIYF